MAASYSYDVSYEASHASYHALVEEIDALRRDDDWIFNWDGHDDLIELRDDDDWDGGWWYDDDGPAAWYWWWDDDGHDAAGRWERWNA